MAHSPPYVYANSLHSVIAYIFLTTYNLLLYNQKTIIVFYFFYNDSIFKQVIDPI